MAIIDVVKIDVLSDDYIVQKFASGKQWELALGSQLVVNEGQEAIFVKGGIALDTFAPGTHTLVSGNVPLLNSILKLPFGGTTHSQPKCGLSTRRRNGICPGALRNAYQS